MAEKLIGSSSFSTEIGGPSSQAQGNVSANSIKGGFDGAGASQLTALAPGGDFEKAGNMFKADVDAMFAMAEKIMEPKVKEMQAKQFTAGVSRVARGESMKKINEEQPFWSKMFGDTAVVQGARYYAVKTKSVREQQDLLDMIQSGELNDMDPVEADKLISDRMLKQHEDLDPESQSLLTQNNVAAMPQIMSAHQTKYYRNVQEESAANMQQYTKANVDLIEKYRAAYAAGNMSKEDMQAAITNAAQSFVKPEGISEEAYTSGMMATRAYAIEKGVYDIESFMQDASNAQGIAPGDRLMFIQQAQANRDAAVAASMKKPEVAKAYTAAYLDVKSLPPEQQYAKSLEYNQQLEEMTGIKGGVFIDSNQIAVSAASEAASAAKQNQTIDLQTRFKINQDLISAMEVTDPNRKVLQEKNNAIIQEAAAAGRNDLVGPMMVEASQQADVRPISEKVAEGKDLAKLEAESLKKQTEEAAKEQVKQNANKQAVLALNRPDATVGNATAILEAGGYSEDEIKNWQRQQFPTGNDLQLATSLSRAGKLTRTGGTDLHKDIRNEIFQVSAADAVRNKLNHSEGLLRVMRLSQKDPDLQYSIKKEMGAENYNYSLAYQQKLDAGATQDDAHKAGEMSVEAMKKKEPGKRPSAPAKEVQASINKQLKDSVYGNMAETGAKRSINAEISSRIGSYGPEVSEQDAIENATKAVTAGYTVGSRMAIDIDESAEPIEKALARSGAPYGPDQLDAAIVTASVNYLNALDKGNKYGVLDGNIVTENGTIIANTNDLAPIQEVKMGGKIVYRYTANDGASPMEIIFTRDELIQAYKTPLIGARSKEELANERFIRMTERQKL